MSTNYRTPDETVAKIIIERLIEASLLPSKYADSVQQLLTSGASSSEDWQLLAEKSIELASRNKEDE